MLVPLVLTHPLCVPQASTCSSDGTLTVDLIQEDSLDDGFREDSEKSKSGPAQDRPRSKTDGATRSAEASGKSQSPPQETVVWEKASPAPTPQPAEKNHCSSMDQILAHSESRSTKTSTLVTSQPSASTLNHPTAPVRQLQELISQKLERTEQLLREVRVDREPGKSKGVQQSPEGARVEAQRLLKEAAAAWNQAREVLEEVKELKVLYEQLDSTCSVPPSNSTKLD